MLKHVGFDSNNECVIYKYNGHGCWWLKKHVQIESIQPDFSNLRLNDHIQRKTPLRIHFPLQNEDFPQDPGAFGCPNPEMFSALRSRWGLSSIYIWVWSPKRTNRWTNPVVHPWVSPKLAKLMKFGSLTHVHNTELSAQAFFGGGPFSAIRRSSEASKWCFHSWNEGINGSLLLLWAPKSWTCHDIPHPIATES